MKLVISDSKNFIIITCQLKEGEVLSWEQLQEVKDEFHPKKDFIEIYPKKNEIINKANERHLVHQKGVITPKMENFEEEANVVIIEEHYNRYNRNKRGDILAGIATDINVCSEMYKRNPENYKLLRNIGIV